MIAGVSALLAEQASYQRAHELYDRTAYGESLKLLLVERAPDAATNQLIGLNYFMQGDFRKASDFFSKAAELAPKSSEYMLWLGRAYGRRAETASPFTAPMMASKARQAFEAAVSLDPQNKEALNDLFDYYLNAPGFLGGGLDKASALARRIAELDAAEGHFAEAQLHDRKKEFGAAEAQLRRAMELAPRQVGRILDLARYLYKEGRPQDGDAIFAHAEKIAPNSPKVMFVRAETYVQNKRNLEQAKLLLRKYLNSPLTPDDPPRSAAQKLLHEAEQNRS